ISVAEQEIAVAGDEVDDRARCCEIAQGVGDLPVQRCVAVVVTGPVFEQITEDIERRHAPRRPRQEGEKGGGGLRALFGQMQVGDEQGLHRAGVLTKRRKQTISARSMTTSSTGTS